MRGTRAAGRDEQRARCHDQTYSDSCHDQIVRPSVCTPGSTAARTRGTIAPSTSQNQRPIGHAAWVPLDDPPAWVEPLCLIAQEWNTGDRSIRQQFERASPDLSDAARAQALIRHRLAEEPAIAEAWQIYSYEKRSRPRHYLDDCEVGYFDGKRRSVVRYDDRLDACADFIVREARSVLTDA